MSMKTTIYRGLGKLAICPKCGGAMITDMCLQLRCWDCGVTFVAIGEGISEREIEYEEVS